jgi:hypothetical protein
MSKRARDIISVLFLIVFNVLVIVGLTSLCSCGAEEEKETRECTGFIHEGICITENSYNIDPTMISFVVESTDRHMERYFNPMDIPSVAADRELKADFINHVGRCGGACIGLYIPHEFQIYVQADPEGDTQEEMLDECVDRYYVFGHELLHFVSHEITHKDNEDVNKMNVTHVVPNVFLEWCVRDLDPDTSTREEVREAVEHCAEWHIAQDVNVECMNRYKPAALMQKLSPFDLVDLFK